MIIKLLFSICLMRYLLTMYRKNLTIRTGRSPLRKQVQSPRDEEEVGGSGGDEGSPVLKARLVNIASLRTLTKMKFETNGIENCDVKWNTVKMPYRVMDFPLTALQWSVID